MDPLSEGLRKLILAGIGAVAATKEKSEGILNELVKKGELTVERRSAGVDVRVERKKEINASINKTAHAFSLGMGACFTAAHPSSRIPHG